MVKNSPRMLLDGISCKTKTDSIIIFILIDYSFNYVLCYAHD